MSHPHLISEEHTDALQSPYTCIKCGEGSMVPAVHQEDSEYTDDYVCVKCNYHDVIPTPSVLFSQVATSLVGLLICAYLFSTYIFASQSEQNYAEQISLGLVVSAFLLGFLFILYKATSGFIHRKLYTQ
jgi:ribosomal protein S27AE